MENVEHIKGLGILQGKLLDSAGLPISVDSLSYFCCFFGFTACVLSEDLKIMRIQSSSVCREMS